MKVSFSSLDTYEKCPYKYFKRKVLEEEEKETLPLALGKATHKAIESKLKGKSHEIALIEGYAETNFFPEIRMEELNELVSAAPIENFRVGVEVEKYFELPLSSEPNAPILRGYIDIADKKGTFLADWKTNRKVYSPLATYQLGLYAWALCQIHKKKEIVATLYFLRFKKQMVQAHIFNENEMEYARKWAYNLAKEIQNKVTFYEYVKDFKNVREHIKKLFPARPSGLCSYCPFAVDCYLTFSENEQSVLSAN